jgi:xanthine dehydrogenase YagR molybdenum-binding subunit
MVAVHDCGLPINRLALESQINGGMIQSLGYALTEKSVLDPQTGNMLNATMDEYKLPGCFEMPELVPLIDDGDTRNVAIGIAEACVIPGASAIANAVYSACGVRVTSLPITPDKILNGLAKLKKAEEEA